MRVSTCEACGGQHPLGQMLNVQGRTLCAACGAQFFQGRAGNQRAVRHVDPTICVNCGADNGDAPHGELMKLPTCPRCIAFYRNRPFPGWVKAAFAAILALVVFSLAWPLGWDCRA